MRYLLPLVFAGLAFAQLDPYTLTVTASRAVTTTPDQVSLGVFVTSPQSASLADVLAIVQAVGLTQANLINVTAGTGTNPEPLVYWTFTTTVSYSGMKDAITKFNALQSAVMKKNPAFDINFGVSGVQTSPQAVAAQTCPMATLMADARGQAQALAQAAGFGLGSISTITDSGGIGIGGVGVAQSAGSTFNIATGIVQPYYASPSQVLICTIIVKFKLTLS